MDTEQLRVWEAELLAEQQELAALLDPLLTRREELLTKLDLVRRLIAMEDVQPGRRNDFANATPSVGGTELQAAVRTILEEQQRPMHIRDIRAALVERGVPIPGKGTDANIIVHLRRARETFTKRGRGTYALKSMRNAGRHA